MTRKDVMRLLTLHMDLQGGEGMASVPHSTWDYTTARNDNDLICFACGRGPHMPEQEIGRHNYARMAMQDVMHLQTTHNKPHYWKNYRLHGFAAADGHCNFAPNADRSLTNNLN